jgi:23S rRNA (cytosine1962-C5)-methyltransferase
LGILAVSELIRPTRKPVRLTLGRDLVRSIRSGHPWVYRDALRDPPPAEPGTGAELFAPDGRRPIAAGIYAPKSALAFRVCRPEGISPLDDDWAASRFEAAIRLREQAVPPETTGYRILNGEGDGVPGLIVDRYDETAVLKFDGPGPAGFWNGEGIAHWLAERLGLTHVIERSRDRDVEAGVLLGNPPREVEFLERSLKFKADVIHGQKTGFFLDQRENRQLIRGLSAGRNVLNVFSYTGGFSVAAGVGGATHVTSVDVAAPALAAGDRNWLLNGLEAGNHQSIAADAFEYLEQAAKEKRRWDVVIVDPPSFAPSAKSVDRAIAAYTKLIAGGVQVVSEGGLFAAASCSSHIGLEEFLQCCATGTSQGRRRARVLEVRGQPADHPWPLVCPELRYLKFVLMQMT